MKKSITVALLIATSLFSSSFVIRRACAETPVCGAACVIEAESRRILYAERETMRLPMASTTKILTAITVLENNEDLSKKITIPSEAAGVEGSSVYLKAGETYDVESLLYGLMLRSGNDCAVALAIETAGSISDFATMMHLTAQKAGAIDGNFVTPHGLHDERHFTTAKDLCYMTAYALRDERFAKIVSTKYYEPYGWKNKNKMLYTFDGAIGVKTGYTKKAGRCLVSAAKRGDTTLVCTVLNAPEMYKLSERLLEDAFCAYQTRTILSADTPVEVKTETRSFTGHTGKDLKYPLLDEECERIEREVISRCNGKKTPEKGEIIGEIRISLLNRLLFSENLYKL